MKLLPCPFCGAKDPFYFERWGATDMPYAGIDCCGADCNVTMIETIWWNEPKKMKKDMKAAKAKVIAKWNKRVIKDYVNEHGRRIKGDSHYE